MANQMYKIKAEDGTEILLVKRGADWYYGVKTLMNNLNSFTKDFQNEIFKKFGVIH
jgi:hypothetical protein